jgi:hypothetical protein
MSANDNKKKSEKFRQIAKANMHIITVNYAG